MNITITKFLASVLVIVLHQSVGQQWVEEVDQDGRPTNMDIYFDRVVMITDKQRMPSDEVICTGVFIDKQRVLTSFTPFRQYVKLSRMGDLGLTILNERKRNGTSNTFIKRGHYLKKIACYEKVKKIAASELTSEQWHGFRKEHSPVHDLYIIKFDDLDLEFLDPNPRLYSFAKIGNNPTVSGPMITILAKKKDALESGMKFASLGYKDDYHITYRNRLRSYEYPYGTNAEVDCDEWMIRDWGRFICLKNNENYLGIQAGSVLIHKDKLYGIGCFTLKKGNESIYVFTDIRAYRKDIFRTCGAAPTNVSDLELFKLQGDPEGDKEDVTTTTPTPRPLLHLGRRYYDDWF